MSSSSYASLAGLAVLENPRKITKKGLVIDATFYLGAADRQSILASLRYFNSKDEVFPEVGLYFVYTTHSKVAQMDPSVEVFTGEESGSELTPDDFALVRDIQFLFHLGHPSEAGIDYRQRPYAHICGAAFNVDVPSATFSVTADQYTGAFREMQKKTIGAPAAKSVFSTICTIQDSPRYENIKKPVPFNKRFIMATGLITGLTSTLDNGKVKESYHVDVENIVFLGNYVPPATPAGNSPVPSSSTMKSAPGTRLKRWSYDNLDKDPKRRKSSDAEGEGDGSSSAAPSSPSPVPSIG
ncbi:hypothetical protein C8F04DRAFT_1176827 [Mycena alexandri]|uniref:Uncharacterized protein n=1 Tax=Mycena alexandri TaxID=1745969 RepID=A0AAD6XBB8_9AGAR|nr:hypothetical protein C8F04DRAFT_1176827 [Mycena alexandri]